ncbi:MAG: FHA domain-containing protein [Gaiellales bacterium]
MVEQLLLLFQVLFIVLLYVFIWRVMRGAGRGLRVPEGRPPAPARGGNGAGVIASPSRPTLVVVESPALERGSSFSAASTLSLGRHPENAVPLVADDFASGYHARIEPVNGEVWVVDLDSRNGTFVNGRRVEGRARVAAGDVVRVGGTDLRVES